MKNGIPFRTLDEFEGFDGTETIAASLQFVWYLRSDGEPMVTAQFEGHRSPEAIIWTLHEFLRTGGPWSAV